MTFTRSDTYQMRQAASRTQQFLCLTMCYASNNSIPLVAKPEMPLSEELLDMKVGDRNKGKKISLVWVENYHREPTGQYSQGEKPIWAFSTCSQMLETHSFFLLAVEALAEKPVSPLWLPLGMRPVRPLKHCQSKIFFSVAIAFALCSNKKR